MIPKIIHFCWISGDEFPEQIRMCIDSWKRYLPDYEIVLWDYEKVQALNVRWCEEAIAARKYAFVADYVRFYALHNYGGIYLDSDVEVLKPFDDLLNLKYFVGKEQSIYGWEGPPAAVCHISTLNQINIFIYNTITKRVTQNEPALFALWPKSRTISRP
ncbi:MAG: glycosyltransferase family 32 protein [Candidatus Cryptobacteroides sp.]